MTSKRGEGLRRWWAKIKAEGAVPPNHGKHVNGFSTNKLIGMAEKHRAWNQAYWTPERRQAQAERMRQVYRTWGDDFWTPERRREQAEAVKKASRGPKKGGLE